MGDVLVGVGTCVFVAHAEGSVKQFEALLGSTERPSIVAVRKHDAS